MNVFLCRFELVYFLLHVAGCRVAGAGGGRRGCGGGGGGGGRRVWPGRGGGRVGRGGRGRRHGGGGGDDDDDEMILICLNIRIGRVSDLKTLQSNQFKQLILPGSP